MLDDTRRERFCQEIAAGEFENKALEKAGFPPNTHGLLEKPEVLERIAYYRRADVEAASITRAIVIQGIKAIATTDIREVVEWGVEDQPYAYDHNGQRTGGGPKTPFVRVRNSADLSSAAAAAVAEVKLTKDGITIKMHDKPTALHKLGLLLGMFTEKLELSGPNGKPIETITSSTDPRLAAELYARLIKNEA